MFGAAMLSGAGSFNFMKLLLGEDVDCLYAGGDVEDTSRSTGNIQAGKFTVCDRGPGIAPVRAGRVEQIAR